MNTEKQIPKTEHADKSKSNDNVQSVNTVYSIGKSVSETPVEKSYAKYFTKPVEQSGFREYYY